MPNDFEKQVKDKMEELQFAPSEPVWEKIEEQIRYKKDRRRVFLWIPLLIALLGVGIWWLNTTGEHRTATAQIKAGMEVPVPAKEISKPAPSTKPNTISENPLNRSEKNSTEISTTVSSKNQDQLTVEENTVANIEKVISTPPVNKKKAVTGGRKSVKTTAVVTATAISGNTKADIDQTSGQEEFNKAPNASPNAGFTMPRIEIKRGAIYHHKGIQDARINMPDMKPVHNTNVAAPVAVQGKRSKWRFGVLGDIGASGAGNQFTLLRTTEEKTRNVVASAPNPQPVIYPEYYTNIRNSLAFSVGLVVKRSLSKRFYASSGLEYNFYSTLTEVGYTMVNLDQNSGGSFTTSVVVPASASNNKLQKYYNQYHFISLPLNIEFQLIRKLPLHIHGGVAIQQLVSTDALIYDKKFMLLKSESNGFNNTQLFSSLGADYALVNGKRSLLVGPEFRYGISSLEKGDNSKHLFSFGIRAQYLFKK